MQIFGRTITKDGNAFPSSFISIIKDLQKRLDEVEHELWNTKFVLDELTHGKAKYLLDTSTSTSDIANKLHRAGKKHKELNDDHLKQARDFIKTMVENDRKDIQKNLQMRESSLLQFLPHVDDVIPGSASSQRFFDSFDSENLLKVFEKKRFSKKQGELDTYLLKLGPDVKVRRMSRSVSVVKNKVRGSPKTKLKTKLKTASKIKSKSISRKTKSKKKVLTSSVSKKASKQKKAKSSHSSTKSRKSSGRRKK